MDKQYIEDNIISKTGRVSSRMAKKYNVSVEEIYNIYFNEKGWCKNCKIKTSFISFTKGYNKFCSISCSTKYYSKLGSYDNAQAKAKATNIKRYGDENYNNRNKAQKTNLKRYGCLNTLSNGGVRDKAKITKLEKYSDENYNNKILRKNNNIIKWGTENHMQSIKFWELNPHFGYGWKNYVLPSGNTIKVQGYEGKLLDELLHEYNEGCIITSRKDMPEFWYLLGDDTKHRYFPDMYIPSTETLYEVKSKYTLKKAKEGGIFELKAESVRQAGYNFILKVY